MNNYEFINFINAKLVQENLEYNYLVNIGPLYGYNKDNYSIYLLITDKLQSDYIGTEVYDLISSLSSDNWFEILHYGIDNFKPGIDYKLSESLYNLIQDELNKKNNVTDASKTFLDSISNENLDSIIDINFNFNEELLYNDKNYELNIKFDNCNNEIAYATFEISDLAFITDNDGNRKFYDNIYITNNDKNGVVLPNSEYNYNIKFIQSGIYNYVIKIVNVITHAVIGYKYGEISVKNNSNMENYILPDYWYYNYNNGVITPNLNNWIMIYNDTNLSLNNIDYYYRLNIINNSEFTKEELDNFYITFNKFILDNTMLKVYVENNYIYLNVLNYFANGSTDAASVGINLILGSSYGTVSTNTYSSCGCNNKSSTVNDKTCFDLYKEAMLIQLKKMLGDVNFYYDWFFINEKEYPNNPLIDGLLKLINNFLLLDYTLTFDKNTTSKCNCDAISDGNNCNKETLLNYVKVLNWVKENKIEENTNKIKIYGEAFAELLPKLQF